MRVQFLRDNRKRPDEDNYEFKRRDRNDEVPITKEINDQQKKKKIEDKVTILFFGFEHVYFRG